MTYYHQPLGELVSLRAGYGFPVEMQGRTSGKYPFAKVGDISRCGRSNSSFLTAADHYIDEADLSVLRAKPIPAGSVVFAKIGEAIRQNHRVMAACEMLIDNNAMAAIPSEKVHGRFLYHFLKTVDFYALASATTVPALRKSDLEKLPTPCPPLNEQRRIATVLDKADALRAKRREALAQLDQLAQSIFVEMFGDSATNSKGWPRCQLSTLVAEGDSINYGVVQPGDDSELGVPLVRVGDLHGGCVSHLALKKISPQIESAYKRSRLKGDEILVSCVGSIGVVALATEAENGFNIARAVARVRLGDSVEREYVAEHLRSESVQNYFRQELRTVSQPTLNIKQIAETSVMFPPKALQTEFVRRFSAVKALTALQLQASEKAANLFASLQRQAFQGEL